ncbi:MAG: hypothetical protein RBU30_01305 [Polyangia bacterium]|jgi:hypothetical protein|nr:hypothetical protein [Polyangia bacterium]
MAYYPGKKVEHKGPRAITLAKVLLAVLIVVGTYLAITFAPPYYRYFKASSVMTEEAQKAYSRRRDYHSWSEIHASVYAQVRSELLSALKIPEDQLHLSVEKRDGDIYVNATWKTFARWPLVGKTTKLSFKEEIHFAMR